MILDKHSERQVAGRRSQVAGRRPQVVGTTSEQTGETAAKARSLFSIFNFQFSIRRRSVRLGLLILVSGALALVGAAIGRGLGPSAAVVGQAIGPTIAPPATPAAQPPAAPTVVAAAAPAPAQVGVPAPAVPTPGQPASAEEAWPLLAEEHFDGVSERWPEVRSSPSWSSRYQDGGYVMQVDSRPGISYSGPLGAHDFWYGADVRIVRGQGGLFFLIGRPNDFYRLLIDTEGRYQLEWQQVGVSQPLIAWTASGALRPGENALNQLAVRRGGDELALYANGRLLATYALPPGNTLESRIGLALDAPGGGRSGLAWFDNLVVRAPGP